MSEQIKHGDFTGLALSYSQYRPNYSQTVLKALIGMHNKDVKDLRFVDIGAGTGIWSRMVYEKGVKSVISVEPNKDMRKVGVKDSINKNIKWMHGTAEKTGLPENSCDWVTMASSFHWADFDLATKEINRILCPGGFFTALWNPRLIENNQILLEIENYVNVLMPNIKRVSSGRSGITKNLTQNFEKSKYFEDIIYIEGKHKIEMTHERYLGIWDSVNDLKFQLGQEKFEKFLSFVKSKISKIKIIEAEYLTRSWTVRSKV